MYRCLCGDREYEVINKTEIPLLVGSLISHSMYNIQPLESPIEQLMEHLNSDY